MNPPTRLQKKKHRSLLLFHILQFPRKQSHPSCWLDGETKLKVDLFPPPPPPATALDCSRRTNNNSQLRPSRVPSTGAVIYSALSEHKHTHTRIFRTITPATPVHQQALWENENVKREREPPFLPFSSPLSSSLIILRSFLPSVSLALYSHLAVFLPPPARRFSLTVCFLSLIVSPPPPSLYSPKPLAI